MREHETWLYEIAFDSLANLIIVDRARNFHRDPDDHVGELSYH